MKRRSLIRLILLVLALVVVRLVLRTGEPATTSVSESSASADVAYSANEAVSLAEPVGPPTGERTGLAETSPTSTAKSDASVLVRVIAKDSKAPVVGATVRWIDVDEASDMAARLLTDRTARDLALDKANRTFSSDEHGEVRVPKAKRVACLDATNGLLRGEVVIRDQTSVTVALVEDRDVRVQVFDCDGKPLGGATVMLRAVQSIGSNREQPLCAVTRDEDGIAVLRHAASFMLEPPSQDYVVMVDGLFAEPPELAISATSIPPEPLRIDLPPTGSVEVRELDARGELVHLERDIRVVVPDPDWPLRGEGTAREQLRTVKLTARDGVANVPFVGLGLNLVASDSTPERGVAIPDSKAAGPRVRGERVRLVLGGPSAVPYCSARLVDDDGQAMVRCRFQLELRATQLGHPEFVDHSTSEVSSDDTGRIECALRDSWAHGWKLYFGFRSIDPTRVSQVEAHSIFERDWARGENDIGDLTLHAPRMIASGRVVDELGAPASRIPMRLCATKDPLGGSNNDWVPVGAAASANERGEFALEGVVDAPTVDISVGGDREFMWTERQTIAVGSTGLTLVAKRAAVLEGSLLVDEGVEVADINADCRASDQTMVLSLKLTPTDDPTRLHFAVGGLTPMLYDVEFRGCSGAELARVERVDARRGAHDPRLVEIDLRGRVHVFELRVRDSNGKPPERALVRTRPSGSSEALHDALCFRGLSRLVETASSIDVVVCAQGHRTAKVDHVTGDTTVMLEAGFPVRVALTTSPDLRESGVRLTCNLSSRVERGNEMAVMWNYLIALDADGRGSTVVDHVGEYEIDWFVDRTNEFSGGRKYTISPAKRTTLSVKDFDGEQRFELALDPKLLEPALAELEKSTH